MTGKVGHADKIDPPSTPTDSPVTARASPEPANTRTWSGETPSLVAIICFSSSMPSKAYRFPSTTDAFIASRAFGEGPYGFSLEPSRTSLGLDLKDLRKSN